MGVARVLLYTCSGARFTKMQQAAGRGSQRDGRLLLLQLLLSLCNDARSGDAESQPTLADAWL